MDHSTDAASAPTPQVEVALRVVHAVEERDPEALLALLHEDVEFHEAPSLPYGGSTSGKEALRDRLEREPAATWLGTWGPLQPTEHERRMHPRVVAQHGDDVVVEYRQRAVSATGARFDAPVLALYEVRDGKLARAQMFHFDTAAIARFLDASGRASARA